LNDNFIYTTFLEDISICDTLIQFHKDCPNKRPGLVGSGVRPEIKNSTDVTINNIHFPLIKNPQLLRYHQQLVKVLNNYANMFPYSKNEYMYQQIKEPYNIQHYAPSQGFYSWHCERGDTHPETVLRHLVFMTYLNDVTDGGETEFYYQKLKIKPEKGKTVIWPADWTYTHRGITSTTQEKYIVTGWVSFI
jgi:prolyl 4-hydroxylase